MGIKNILYKYLAYKKAHHLINTKNDELPFERCIMCGKITTVRKNMHIDLREYYEVGAGQVCYECHKKIIDNTTCDGK